MQNNKNSFLTNLFYILAGNRKELSLQHRLFNITILSTAFFVFAGTIVNIYLDLNIYIKIYTASLFLFLVLIYYLSIKYKVYKVLLLLYLLLVLITVVSLWFINAGSKGPTAFSFIIIIYIFNLLYENKKKILINLFIIFVFTSLYVVEYYYPNLVVGYETESDRFFDNFFTAIFYIGTMSFISVFFFKSFYDDKKLTEIQRDEIIKKNIEIQNTQKELYKHKENLEELVEKRTKALINSNKELVNAKEKAENADKLKTAFLSNMSHEIRTPMNSIIGLSQLIQRKELDKIKHDEYISTIISKGHLLLNIIDDILDIAKIEANELNINIDKCEVNTLLNDIYLTFENNLKTDVKLNLEITNDISNLVINTDSLRLKQVLINLVENARKFTIKGTITIGCKINNNDIEFYVKDTGIGIPDDKQDIIFNRFRQIQETNTKEYGGAGLGLTISKKIIELMYGDIWLSSELNKGSTFSFKIPLNIVDASVNIKEKTYKYKKDWSNKTILLAEDEEFNFIILKDLFEETKINIIRAINGIEVIEILESNTDIDLILLDIQMPIMSGYEVCPIVKTKYKNIPVIAQTAYVMSEDKAKLKEMGCDNIITKPIDFDDLLEIIEKYL